MIMTFPNYPYFIIFQHIELAPKDILGDFPRLTKDAAHLVVAITEAHRRGDPMDVENIPGIMEFKGRGFKCKYINELVIWNAALQSFSPCQ